MLEAPTVDGNTAIFALATGEKIRVQLIEGGLGIYGYAVKALSDRGTVLVQPSAGNAVDIYTARSLAAQQAEQERIVAERGGLAPVRRAGHS